MEQDIRTKCIRGDFSSPDHSGAISAPIYQTASFAHPGVGQSTGYDYTREKNPTRQRLEDVMTSLEGAADSMAFASGMAALSALMELFSPGDHIISSDDLYGGSLRLFKNISQKNGIDYDTVDTRYIENIEAVLKPQTKAIYVETPSNPMMHVTDLRSVSAFAKKHGLLLIVDNTFLSSYFQNPIRLGADLVIHSATKYLGGHNDTVAGILCAASHELSAKLRLIYKTTGAGLSPFDSWLITRGIKTLSVRMDRQQENAFAVAKFLQSHPKVSDVFYVGLPSHPEYDISKSQTTGFGSMVSFRVDTPETARQVLQRVKIIMFAESLGGVESLITYPMMQTHTDVPENERERLGITNTLLRMSVGIEAEADLLADLKQALSE